MDKTKDKVLNPKIASQYPQIDDPTRTNSQTNPPQTELLQVQISLHALSKQSAPKTLQMMGWISNQKVVILIDGENMHNFVQEHLVKSLV